MPLGVPPDRWPEVNLLAQLCGTVASVRIAEKRRRASPGLSEDRALAIGAGEIGLSGETVRTRLRSFFQDVHGGQKARCKARCLSPNRETDAKGNTHHHEISGGGKDG